MSLTPTLTPPIQLLYQRGVAVENKADPSVGIAIAHLAAEPPADKVTELSNSQLLQIANKYRPAA